MPSAVIATAPQRPLSLVVLKLANLASSMAFFDARREMNEAGRCRVRAEECHRLMLLAQSGAEATILTSLTRSWKMIANQTDRYVAIMKREAAQKNR
jgi:hypothetical protein